LGIKEDTKIIWDTDDENEMTILSHCLSSLKRCGEIRAEIEVDDFLMEGHRVIFWTLNKMLDGGMELSLNTFDTIANTCPNAQDYGGREYLEKIRIKYNKDDTLEFHIEKLKRDHHLADIYRYRLPEINEIAFDPSSTVGDVQAKFQKIADELIGSIKTTSHCGDELVESYLEEYEKRISSRRIECGINSLDGELTWGFAPGTVTVMAGRTGMGKSMLALNMVDGFAKNGHGVFFATLEMDETSMMNRMVSRATGIPLTPLIRGNIIDEQKEKQREATTIIGYQPIHFFDKRGCKLQELEAELMRAKSKKPVDVVVIDLFGYIDEAKGDARDIENALMNVRTMAYKHDVHIILVVQIQRRAEERRGKMPELRDLKWSGAYEETADIVLLLYREDVYGERSDPNYKSNKILTVKIDKQRDGPVKLVQLYCDPSSMLITDLPKDRKIEAKLGAEEDDSEDINYYDEDDSYEFSP
jgi:replicative DNA helicase